MSVILQILYFQDLIKVKKMIICKIFKLNEWLKHFPKQHIYKNF